MSTLESILSGEGAVAPEPNATATPETPPEPPQGAPDPSPNDEPQTDERGMVPVAALQAERQKAKRYTEQVAEFQQKLEQQNAQWEQRFNQIITAVVPKQAQPEAAPAPEIWDKPDEFVDHRLDRRISPIREQMLAMARQVAEIQFQPDAVKVAEEAFNRAAATGQMDPDTFRRINSSPNPFAAAVQWHQNAQAMSEIGSDPAAYKARLAEEIRAQVMAEMQAGAAPPGIPTTAPVMPSNFTAARNVGTRSSGPAWAGPAPLNDIFSRRK